MPTLPTTEGNRQTAQSPSLLPAACHQTVTGHSPKAGKMQQSRRYLDRASSLSSLFSLHPTPREKYGRDESFPREKHGDDPHQERNLMRFPQERKHDASAPREKHGDDPPQQRSRMRLPQERNMMHLPQDNHEDASFPREKHGDDPPQQRNLMHLPRDNHGDASFPREKHGDDPPQGSKYQCISQQSIPTVNPGPNGARNPPTLSNPLSVVWP